jgi:5-formyltetrahydrofolate cyclo-ligase
MEPLHNNKAQLRKLIATVKKKVSSVTLDAHSRHLLRQLEAHPHFQAAQTVLLYYSLPDEPNTHAFIARWARRKCILLPAVCGERLELRRYTPKCALAKGAYGIAEPIADAFTDYAAVDVALVPGMAFDRQGNRLGRGKGYYDALLPKLPSAYRIGICFPFQYLDVIPADASDARVDEVLAY